MLSISVRSVVFVEGGLNTNCTDLSNLFGSFYYLSTKQIYLGNIKETRFKLI